MKYPVATIIDKVKLDTDVVEVKKSRLCYTHTNDNIAVGGSTVIEPREDGDFAKHAFWLNADYDWVIAKDNLGSLILVPLQKFGE